MLGLASAVQMVRTRSLGCLGELVGEMRRRMFYLTCSPLVACTCLPAPILQLPYMKLASVKTRLNCQVLGKNSLTLPVVSKEVLPMTASLPHTEASDTAFLAVPSRLELRAF